MEVKALLTSAGINIGICILLFSLYAVLRKQPSNKYVYFGRRLAKMRSGRHDPNWLDRFVPDAGWIIKALGTSEDVILAIGGLDAVVFVRTLVLCMRIFSIAVLVCMITVLPMNYYGQNTTRLNLYGRDIKYMVINLDSLEVFTTLNIKRGSKWIWAHCLALYIISFSSCYLLYVENKNIIRRRITYIRGASRNLSQFAVLVRGIPWSPEVSYGTILKNYFTKYYPSTYLSHQMVYQCGEIQKLMQNDPNHQNNVPICKSCGFDGRSNLSNVVSEPEQAPRAKNELQHCEMCSKEKECPAAFVFFKTRYHAASAAYSLQSSNPMQWVTHWAPEPNDALWSNLWIPYRQFWVRRIATFVATSAFLILFLVPVTIVQGLANMDQLKETLPFMKTIIRKKYLNQLVTGYLPSVILIVFSLTVAPLMMLFSTMEGSISRSGRKKAACCKVLLFTIWNNFFVNVGSGAALSAVISKPKEIPLQLAAGAVPAAVNFFMSYVLTSGWTGLACEVVQLYPLLYNFTYKFILRKKKNPFANGCTFPYHTELPKVLLFGLLGLIFAVVAPLILPLLLIYYCLGYLVYRNQILNVYVTEYDSGGKYWPIVNSSTIFSLVLAQIIAMGVFVMKRSTICLSLTILLTVGTLLFNEYCRRRFLPAFRHISAEVLIDLDQQDDQSGKMDDIHQQVQSAYCQFEWITKGSSRTQSRYISDDEDSIGHSQEHRPENEFSQEIIPSDFSQEITEDVGNLGKVNQVKSSEKQKPDS